MTTTQMLHDGTNQSSTTVVDTFGTRRADTIFQQIGAGECGSVWAWHDTHEVNKCQDAAASSTTGRSLRNEYDMHLRVLKSLEKVMAAGLLFRAVVGIRMPMTGGRAVKSFSDERGEKAFGNCDILCSERIRPLPQRIRGGLVGTLCPEEIGERVIESVGDRDCLVSVYLGQRSRDDSDERGEFTCRDFPMYLDLMEELGPDVHGYASVMADVLAMMHWSARVDAAGVEFVLGTHSVSDEAAESSWQCRPADDSSTSSGCQISTEKLHHVAELGALLRGEDIAMHLLDFDQVATIPMTPQGVDLAVEAFFLNDAYYPRPSHKGLEREIWTTFRERYLHTSLRIVEADHEAHTNLLAWLGPLGGKPADLLACGFDERLGLPEMFVRKVEEGLYEREARRGLVGFGAALSEHAGGVKEVLNVV
ncbi:hypothetical protein LTS18_005513 [Coniosporium uncinatum]|uniref:Uncharacterized protein n=1 Tax=Coniosporium uncinatum TaxID=93489 RepID=A0ACC3D4I6_9PEZI|nr:hypothetical protein LTS18_005513 [Coniosporium uncinatum]